MAKPPLDYAEVPEQPKPPKKLDSRLLFAGAALVLASGVALAFVGCSPAFAQGQGAGRPTCVPAYDLALAQLEERHQETPQAGGLSARGNMITVTVNAGRGFSVLVTAPNGTTCMVASGTAWHQNDLDQMVAPAKGDPS